MTEVRERSALPLHPILDKRYSPRAFSTSDVSDADLELVLEAARWAPSSMNDQPWRFLVTRRGGEGHAALLGSLDPSNARWADKAPVLILNMAMRSLTRTGQPNHHARHDLGLAIAQLTAQATALGMGLHQLGGFRAEEARASFQIPDALDLVSVIALGFPGSPDQLPDDLRERELKRSTRRPLEETVHFGRFTG